MRLALVAVDGFLLAEAGALEKREFSADLILISACLGRPPFLVFASIFSSLDDC